MIEFIEGEAQPRSGKPPAGFLSACTDIARLYGIHSGRIECLGHGRRARLRFSKDIPERARQPLRNVWTPPDSPGPRGSRARG